MPTLASSLGADFTFNGEGFSFVHLKTHPYFLLGSDSFSIGPSAFVDGIPTGEFEVIVGGAMRFGRSTFFEIDAGYNYKRAASRSGIGYAGALIIGKQVGSSLRVSLPIIVHYMMQGLPKRWTVDFIPFVGFDINL